MFMNILFSIVTMVTSVTNSTTVFLLHVHLTNYQFSYVDYGYICYHGNIVYHGYQCFSFVNATHMRHIPYALPTFYISFHKWNSFICF